MRRSRDAVNRRQPSPRLPQHRHECHAPIREWHGDDLLHQSVATLHSISGLKRAGS
jgi:hypothetical protein